MKERLHPIMFTGTGSDVGKSIVAAAFCRIFLQDGYTPAPFKAQNMALNSFATPDGLEIGRAQAVQAEAAGVECHTDMNPLLLKPQSDHTSQVVLDGRPVGTRSASEYFRREGRAELRAAVCAAFDRLAARYNPVVMEGAGSMTELNLRDIDLVNLPMAAHAGADVIIVADIDRGGVFASVYGSIALLRPEERRLVKGIIINKFRGDIRLFESGVRIIEELCGVPVLGVIPYYKDIYIEEEDSVALARKSTAAMHGRVNVAVALLRHLSNFTDFNALEHDPRVHLFYTNNTADIEKADIVILPGTKSTIDDLCELRRNGVADAIRKARRNGATVLGICGGYQMLGREVLDPDGVEGGGTLAGLAAGRALLGDDTRILPVSVSAKDTGYEARTARLANEALALLGAEERVEAEALAVARDYYAPGYEIPNEAGNGAVRLLARTEGILLDPVYSGKAFGGMVDQIRRGRIPQGSTVVFWHTGGATALFAEGEIVGDLAQREEG